MTFLFEIGHPAPGPLWYVLATCSPYPRRGQAAPPTGKVGRGPSLALTTQRVRERSGACSMRPGGTVTDPGTGQGWTNLSPGTFLRKPERFESCLLHEAEV